MPTYVYTCKHHTEFRKEMIHSMSEDPTVSCSVCGGQMHRVPQAPMAIAFNAGEILTEWMDENYRRWRTKRPRFSPDRVKRPGKPIPGRQYRSRL